MMTQPRCLEALKSRALPLALIALAILPIAACRDAALTEAASEIPVAPSFGAGAEQNWVRSSFDVDAVLFVDCLGENVRFVGEVPFIYHEVTSSSGNFQFHLQLRPQTPKNEAAFGPFLAQGQTSGKLFEYQNGGPINETLHLAAGEVHTIVDNEVYVAEDGDRLEAHLRLHMTVNANGELTVFNFDFPGFECAFK